MGWPGWGSSRATRPAKNLAPLATSSGRPRPPPRQPPTPTSPRWRHRPLARPPRAACWPSCCAPASLGWLAAVVVLIGTPSQPLGVLALCAPAAEAFEAAEVKLLVELAGDLNFGLSALRTRAALRRSDAMLRETSRVAHIGGWELDVL